MTQGTVPTVPASAKQGTEARNRDWGWVEASVWTEAMVSALGNGVQGGKWFSLIDKVIRPATLEQAWRRVARNKGAAGVDGQSIAVFAQRADRYLQELQTALRDGSYRPQPVRRVEIPKADGKTRPLGIPCVTDRIVQTAVKLGIEPILEARFRDGSYGFRPGRSTRDALRAVDRGLKDGYTWVVDADLEQYFDTIPHRGLMDRVADLISDGRVLDLIESFLQQDILAEAARWTPVAGSPQGAVISPLLSNLYLHPLDEAMEAAGHRMIRYADDFVILCRDEAEARAALDRVRTWVAENGLTLHPGKTHVADCRHAGQGFDFLGYRFENGRRFVRRRSLKAFKDPEGVQGQGAGQDRQKPGRQPEPGHRRPQSNDQGLVRILQTRQTTPVRQTGWVHPETPESVPAKAVPKPRLRDLPCRSSAMAKRLLRSRGAVHPIHSLSGSETLPMRKTTTGEPCAGKPHARFGGSCALQAR